ncbi:MAG: hypothetical protein PWQ25_1279 [Deferribacteres bacterium]|jgi:hypothetical protein|nr:hypothetical protein [Deferribacteres bacterium]
MSFINFFAMLVAALMQHIFGINIDLIDELYTGTNSYKWSFLICQFLIFASILLYIFTDEKKINT